MPIYIVIIGSFINVLGVSVYIKNTILGKTQPNRISWLLWAIAPFIGTAAALSSGVTWAVLPVFIAGFNPFLVFLASFINKKAYWKLEKFDYLCGFFSVLSLVFWAITKDPLIAIILAIISDGLAAIPTILKAWHYPTTETVTPFITGLFSASTSFFVISAWSIESLAFPIYLMIIDTLLIIACYKHFWTISKS